MLVNEQLAVITRFNQGIELSDDDIKQIQDGQLVLVGYGSIAPVTPSPGIGCLEYMRYGDGSLDLDFIIIDGKFYSPINLKEFREILEKAAFNMKAINFCYNYHTRKMFMLNVYPQRCCVCERKETQLTS